MRDKLLLIDAYSIICRGFYALPLLSHDGIYTNAVLGFLNIFYKAVEEENPKYIAVAFDANKKTFRHELYKDYKGNRKSMPDELKEQIPYVKNILTASKIKIFSVDGYEADDILGTLSYKFASNKIEAIILSGDKDMLQLPTDNIKVRLIKTAKGKTDTYEYYKKDVIKELNMTPDEYIDLKAIMGDPSDNIKGLPGIGKITATNLITEYKSIENIKNNIDKITKKSVKDVFTNNYDEALFYKKLVTIKKDVPIECNIEDLKIDNIYNSQVYTLIKQYSLKSLYKKFEKDKKNVLSNKNTSDDSENPFKDESSSNDLLINKNYRIVNNEENKYELIERLNNETGVAGLFLYNDNVTSISFSDITYICLNYNLKKEILESNVKFVICDIKSSIGYFDDNSDYKKEYVSNKKVKFEDVSLMSYLLNSTLKKHNYKTIAKEYLNIELKDEQDYLNKKNLSFYLNNIDDNILEYIFYNSYIPYASYEILYNEIKKQELEYLYNEVELPLTYILYNMEKIGMRIDKDFLTKYDKKLDNKIEKVTAEIYKLAGETFNINSPKQLSTILFEKLNIKYNKKNSEKLSTSIEVLEKIKNEHPIVNKIIEYRTLSKISTTYAKTLTTFVKVDDRIHTKFNQSETATGRLSSENPNLQNIPIKTDIGREFRKVFIPRDEYIFVDADYSQIELRVLAIMSNDSTLIEAYNTGVDVHTVTASQVFNVPIDKVTDDLRRRAKAVNFGLIYGMSAYGLSEDLSIDTHEAKEYIDKYFETYKKIKEYLDNMVIEAQKDSYSKTYFGRRRPIYEFKYGNAMQKAFAKRIAMNSPIQGTASDIIKIAMVSIDNELKKQKLKSRMILQVHDEILIECLKGEEESVKNILQKCMCDQFDFKVKLHINIKTGNNFEEVH